MIDNKISKIKALRDKNPQIVEACANLMLDMLAQQMEENPVIGNNTTINRYGLIASKYKFDVIRLACHEINKRNDFMQLKLTSDQKDGNWISVDFDHHKNT